MAKRLPYLFVGWLWFVITLGPVIGIIQLSLITPYAMADRYHYLPSIGLAIMLAWGIPLLFKQHAVAQKDFITGGHCYHCHSGDIIMAAMRLLERQCHSL